MATKVISGRAFEFKPVSPMVSFRLQPLLAPAIGRVVGLILAVVGDDEGLSLDTLSLDSLAKRALEAPGVLQALASQAGDVLASIKPNDLELIARSLLAGATCDGIPLWPTSDDKIFNKTFAGKLKDLDTLVVFAIMENYADFFPARAEPGAQSPVQDPSMKSIISPGDGPSTG